MMGTGMAGIGMTEEQKALAGLLYDAKYETIERERLRSQRLSYKYNQIPPWEKEKREELIRREMGRVGKNFRIEQPFYCDFWKNVTMGEDFFSNYNFTILAGNRVTFGNDVLFGPNCGIYAAGHPFDATDRASGLEYAWPVRIGNHVWIGGHVAIVNGVTIGDNTVIAAGSVVTENIPGGVLAGGVPCKVIREITSEDDRKYHCMILSKI